jgi:membrane protease YdiL (CAAX protease family)
MPDEFPSNTPRNISGVTEPASTPDLALSGAARGRLWWEIALVLAVGLGQSAVYAIVSLADSLTRPTALSQQTQSLNQDLSDRDIFNLIYQLLALIFALAPVALACFFLWNSRTPHLTRLGIDSRRPLGDTWRGVLLALVIGIPGIGIYLGAKALDLGVTVDAAALGTHWWTVPVLLLSALRAGLQEEVVVLGYLFERLRQLGWGRWRIIVAAAVLRGSYHLYQGFGAFVGNFLMGMLFGFLYSRTKRVLPFVIAHFLIDAAIFVGYSWAAATFPALFGAPSR